MTYEPDYPETDEPEVVDGLPVLASDGVRTALAPGTPAGVLLPSRQVAALAATGFLAGAATVALVHRHKTSKLLSRRKKQKRIGLGEVVGSNSFLVDVHLLRRD